MDNVVDFPFKTMVARPAGAAMNIDPMASFKCASLMEANFQDLGRGVEYALAAFYELYMDTLKALKHKFSEAELKGIILAMNDVILVPQYAGEILISEMQAAVRAEGLDCLVKFNWPRLRTKLCKLTRHQRMVLEIWAHGFWYGAKRPGRPRGASLDRHVYILL